MDQKGQSESRVTTEAAPRAASADEVLAYLTRHPGFLADHPELVDQLTPPAHQHGAGVVDMQQFMLQRLQGELVRVKGQQRALISTSRSNLTSQTRIHAAVLKQMFGHPLTDKGLAAFVSDWAKTGQSIL